MGGPEKQPGAENAIDLQCTSEFHSPFGLDPLYRSLKIQACNSKFKVKSGEDLENGAEMQLTPRWHAVGRKLAWREMVLDST